ncbi:MAG: hypothetical protein FJW32_16290 [Acidobacteria bacterium]|nr:hypothetical protein [Acidobacteriota bacterium]
MPAVFYILLGWLLTTSACIALGAILLKRLRVQFSRDESPALWFVAGSALYSLLIFALGILHLYHRGVIVGAAIVIIFAAIRMGALQLPAGQLPALPKTAKRIAAVCGVPFLLLYLCNAMAPEASPDGSSYHLGLVAKSYREHALHPVTTNMYAALSQGMEMIFLGAYAVGRHSAAALMHFNFLIALPWLMVCYGRRIGQPFAGIAAALLVFASPVVGIDGISAYNDVAAACLLFTLFTVLNEIEQAPDNHGLVVLAGVLSGFAYAIKYTLFPALFLTALYLAWVYRARVFRPLLIVAASSAVSILPWVVKNVVWWQNPLAPFFNHWFPNPYMQYWFEIGYRAQLAKYTLPSWKDWPLDVTVYGAQLTGLLGPVFLLAPIALLSLRTPAGRRLLLAALFFLATYPSNIGTRFLIPALPFAALAMTLPLASIRFAPAVIAILHVVLSLPVAIPRYSVHYAWRLDKWPWRQALRIKSEEEFLDARLSTYAIARTMEQLVPPGRRVLGFSQVPEAYTTTNYLVGFQSAEGNGLRDIFLTALIKERHPVMRLRLRVPAVKTQAIRVVQNRDDSRSQWSVGEMRIWNRSAEVKRAPLWRLRAKPTLHEVQKAFDNSFATRWLTDHGRYNGMYIEVDFGREESIDAVELLQANDQSWEGYHVELRSANGAWTKPKTTIESEELPPYQGMRRAAVEELLRRNVQYILLQPDDYGLDDLQLNGKVWGVQEIADRGGSHLYRLLPKEEFEALPK